MMKLPAGSIKERRAIAVMKRYNDVLEAAKQFEQAKCFVFDMDGLIFDTERTFMEQLAVIMREGGYHLTREVYSRSLGLNGEALRRLMLEEFGEKYPFEEMGAKARQRVNMIAETVGLQMKPNIRELLEYLADREIPCAVASSTQSDVVADYLEKADIRRFFRHVIGGEMVAHSKPAPEIFLLACEKCDVAPQDAVVLEDSENGIRAAHAAHIPVICVPDLKWPSKALEPFISCIVADK